MQLSKLLGVKKHLTIIDGGRDEKIRLNAYGNGIRNDNVNRVW